MINNSRLRPIAIVFAVLVLAACSEQPTASGATMPPPQVGVMTVEARSIQIMNELPGRLEASRTAEVRARAAGIVLERTFREGSEVEAGELLFRIDPAPLKAALNTSRAQLTRAQANLKQARIRAERYAPLVEINAVSRQDYDDALATRDQAAAEVAAARAAVDVAQLNLGYATVKAPISGRIGRALVTEGALVGQGEVTPLAVIQQVDPVYINLVQSSADLLRLQRALRRGELQQPGSDEIEVTIVTEDGEEYPHTGRLLFSDISVDQSTGAVTQRAEIPNPDRLLLPGMYVRARLQQALASEALTVPLQSLIRSAQGAGVMVVSEDGKAEMRPVTVGRAHGENWIITDGLQAGDQVIVDGLQKVRPGSAVTAVAWENPLQSASTTSSGQAAATEGLASRTPAN